METQKIINLLNDFDNETLKLLTTTATKMVYHL